MNALKSALAVLALGITFSADVAAQATSELDQLLEQTRRAAQEQKAINQQREQEFRQNRDRQRQLLAQARAELQSEENRSDRLKGTFDNNEKRLADLETVLNERMGNLGEMFGVVRQVANDLKGKLDNSLVSAQYPGRQEFLSNLAQRKELPNIQELQQLWYEMQRELTEQGKVVKFTADVLRPSGEVDRDQTIARIGVFNALAGGKFLQWQEPSIDHKNGILAELERQPPARFASLVGDYETSSVGTFAPMAVDFTSGVILSLVVQTKTWGERLGFGDGNLSEMGDAGLIGYVIMSIGMLGLLVAAYRGIMLSLKGMAISKQLKSESPDAGNALGRVMSIYHDNPDADVETLELKLDEAILRETGPLESGLSFIKMLYVIAPLLGLLGTVVGMIGTFQAITLFGTGDPKMMAGGISTALVTTVLGLCVAIPLTFIHSLLQSRSRQLIQILEEQSAGIIARIAEKQDGMAV
ncbi:MAG: MotA/TolQ/ExbB proton channel family protein [Xanthomonadales bacterium]|nr:MotA/TolQ/ExbB proton channel family protein [Xanthomonadales bacterium]